MCDQLAAGVGHRNGAKVQVFLQTATGKLNEGGKCHEGVSPALKVIAK
jgi:hypothetical protein